LSDIPLSFRQWFFAFSALIIVVFLTWGDALNGYFIADDVWHVPLVHRALNGEPWLLWNQFSAPYSFHESLYRMYRPLTDISFSVDYLFWKGNAWGYHLQNLIWHGISACLVFLFSRSLLYFVVIRDLPPTDYLRIVLWKIPLLVALIFTVYPGHAEPVCWPLPRIDLIGGSFTFLSLTCALEFFHSKERRWLVAAILSMIPGLMIKEMCAAIPFVAAVLYTISISGEMDARRRANWSKINTASLRYFVSQLLYGTKLLWPMFAVLAIYIVHRAISLNSVLGGYVGTIGAGLNSTFVQRLFSIDAYWRLFHPINENVLGENCIQDLLLRAVYLLFAVLIAVNQRTACSALRLKGAGRLFILLFIMVVPCLQIWGVTGGLIGARHAYTLSVPFILAVVVLIYPITATQSRMVTNLRRSATALCWAAFVLFFVTAKQYARAWRDATNEIKSIRTQLEEHASYLINDQKLVVMGLPTGIKGYCAFYTIDFLPGLLVPPLSKVDFRSKIICIDGTPTNDFVINYSLLKSFLGQPQYNLLVWQENEKRFVNTSLPLVPYPKSSEELKVDKLGSFVRHEKLLDGLTFFANKTEGADVDSYLLKLDESIDPLDFQVLELKIACSPKSPGGQSTSTSEEDASVMAPYSVDNTILHRKGRFGWLSWSAQTNNKGESAMPIFFPVFESHSPESYKIHLTQYKNWLFSGASVAFRLDLPKKDCVCKLESAVLKQSEDFIPTIQFVGEGKVTTTGLTQTDKNQMRFSYDVSKVPGAKRALVEVSQPYFEFHMQPHSYRQSMRSKDVIYSKELNELSGDLTVPPVVVADPAYYQIRVCALGEKGDVIASFSDPVTVSNAALP